MKSSLENRISRLGRALDALVQSLEQQREALDLVRQELAAHRDRESIEELRAVDSDADAPPRGEPDRG